jgi:hypothetical protein
VHKGGIVKSGIAALWGALLVLVCASAQAGQQTAVDWLQNQIAVDGHFENQAGLATDFQAASAAFRALADQADPAELEAALAFLRTQTCGGEFALAEFWRSEYCSRRSCFFAT